MSGVPAKRIGVDFGRVITGDGGDGDTPFIGVTVEECLVAPPIPGSLEGLRVLSEKFEKRVWIVSKAGPTMQRKTLAWMAHNNFWDRTGMTPWSVCFVLEREEKAKVARHLKLTSFIDDHLDVLEPMKGIVQNLYAFGHGKEVEEHNFFSLPDWSFPQLIV